MANVLWLQGGACSGNTMSFLNAEEPTVVELIVDFGINILWHPTIGLEIGHQVSDLLNDCISGKTQLDIFVFEGSFYRYRLVPVLLNLQRQRCRA
ncbi:MAG: hypothetical protein AAFY48_08685, partial [Bacteroidota bacterium]